VSRSAAPSRRFAAPSRRVAAPFAFALGLACALAAGPAAAATEKPEPTTGITPGKRPPPNYSTAPGSRDWPIDRYLTRFSPAADSAWRRSPAQGIAHGDSLLRLARAAGDRTYQAAIHVWRGRKYANDYRIDEGKPDLDTAWVLSKALRDSAGLVRALIARGHGAQVVQRYDEAVREFDRALPLARAAGLPGLVGFAHRGIGMADKLAGRYASARRHLREAIRLIPENRFENLHSRFLLAEVKNRTGAHDEARVDFLALIDEGRRRLQPWIVAGCFNDLGILEYGEGDMALADRYWEFSAGVFDSIGHPQSALSSNINRAHALVHLGRHDDARELLELLLKKATEVGDPAARNATLTELGTLSFQVGRHAQAEGLLRDVRAAEKEDINEYLAASSALAEVLRATGRAGESEALLDSLLAPEIVSRTMPDALADLRMQRSKTRRALGRPREALADARAAERLARTGRSKGSIYWLDAAIELGRCQREAGSPDSAVAILRSAARTWERWRAEISDLQWRERQGSGLANLFAEYGLALLDPRRPVSEAARARQAFDALQAFQARTLEERMHGRGLSGRAMRSRISADSLRRALRDGELLVDLVATADTTIAFVLTSARLEARLLPGTSPLGRLHDAWREATLGRADDATVRSGLKRLSGELLGPIALAFRGARRVIVTGGGPLALWPWAALTVPGEAGPLCESRELTMAPSATVFAALRGRGGGGRPAGMLAVGRTTDAGGRDLPGAQRELQALGSTYAGVEVRVNRGERAVADLTTDLGRWDVLHFAAHAEAQAGTPWRAGFLLGTGGGDDAYLRASRIAEMRLRADLAVLSGCQSAGTATLAGEGALGLASAFLCSGTRSVVATLWPVEDRVAERFMAEFYAALARGRSVAGAVVESQRALRARSETASARDWAAFIAAGEGGTRVRLARRGVTAAGRP
jgi:tetratricopeptide (TPR) repeat protein